MASSLPTPIEFELPPGWQAIDPDEAGAPDAAFVAANLSMNRPGFTANITIDGDQKPAEVGLADLAEESIQNLHQASQSVALSERTEFGGDEAPGLMQVLRVGAEIGSERVELVQCQVYLLMQDVDRSDQCAVIRLVLTTADDDFKEALPGFQEFISSVRPDASGA